MRVAPVIKFELEIRKFELEIFNPKSDIQNSNISCKMFLKLSSNTSMMAGQLWTWLWLGAVRQAANTWINVDQDLRRYMVSLRHNELKNYNCGSWRNRFPKHRKVITKQWTTTRPESRIINLSHFQFLSLGCVTQVRPLLLTWFNFNPSMDKYSHAL